MKSWCSPVRDGSEQCKSTNTEAAHHSTICFRGLWIHFFFLKVWWKFLPRCWETLGSDCFCFWLRAVLYEKSVPLMCFDLLRVTRLTPTCGCLHLSDQKRSYIWMGVVEISTHSGGSQQEALKTKIFSSEEQRPHSSAHITPLPAPVSSNVFPK